MHAFEEKQAHTRYARPTCARKAERSGDNMSSGTNAAYPMKGRRDFVAAGAASLTLAAAGKYTLAAASAGDSMPCAQSDKLPVNALVFDVFGTVVDWRGSIIREGALLGKRKG